MSLHPIGVLALLAGILLTVAEGVRRRDYSATVNALVALAAALVPVAVDAAVVAVDPLLTLWVALAGLLHAVGMLGPYDTVWWWDHLTHGLSAALVAALAYAAALVLARDGGLPVGPVAATLGFVALAGVAWELLELVARDVAERLDIDPVLVFYGWRDAALDLAFDLFGALVVVLLDVRAFRPVVAPFPDATRAVAGTVVGVAVGASVAMAGYLLVAGEE